MEESLGSGFDRIRAALVSPTNIDSHIPSSPSAERSPDEVMPNSPDSSGPPDTGPDTYALHGPLDDAPRFAGPHSAYVATPQETDFSVGAAMTASAEWFSSEPGQGTMSPAFVNFSHLEPFLPLFTAGGIHVSLTEDTENENDGELIADYDSLIGDAASSPWIDSEDDGSDPEDTRKFYLDDDYDIDETRYSDGMLQMEQYDVYRHADYRSVTQTADLSGVVPHAGSASHTAFESEEPSDGDAHFGTQMHGSSKSSVVKGFCWAISCWTTLTWTQLMNGTSRLSSLSGNGSPGRLSPRSRVCCDSSRPDHRSRRRTLGTGSVRRGLFALRNSDMTFTISNRSHGARSYGLTGRMRGRYVMRGTLHIITWNTRHMG
jgi:hypothetical protein